ncbi:hypothetical protein pmac_cds_257 [Pandoravirus macleodensis]|uniref:F-box incomplete domain containing protein n=1 Tax=Pandoravirus macleodensis TaxID=2107707 RepID=A0A2U7UF06_9VIRU|nr:hypothetical protein pmac_cds_257 [Pandoravirus macleodensis]AVK76945.1 hypothetical protein pmac_cds_257 [Pandoravirus macleodensis]
MPLDALVAILHFVPSTADLARLGAVSSTLRGVVATVRRQRAHRRLLLCGCADRDGCAHRLANAIMADDVIGMIETLDAASVTINDPLDVEYLQAVAVPNTVVFVSEDSAAGQFQPCRRARGIRGPACFTALGIAVINGATRCARALALMGARVDAESTAALVAFVLEHTAWRNVHAAEAHMLSPEIEIAWPRCRAKRLLDPVKVLAPLLGACEPEALRSVAARHGFLGMARRAALRRLCTCGTVMTSTATNNSPTDRGNGSDTGNGSKVFTCAGTGRHVALDVETLVDDTRRLIKLLLLCGCDPRDPTPSITSPEEMRDRWRRFVCERRRPPLSHEVAGWRVVASSATEYDTVSACIQRTLMASDNTESHCHSMHESVSSVARCVLTAIVTLYDTAA